MTLKYRGSNQPRFDLSSRTSQERSIEKEEETISKFLDEAYDWNLIPEIFLASIVSQNVFRFLSGRKRTKFSR